MPPQLAIPHQTRMNHASLSAKGFQREKDELYRPDESKSCLQVSESRNILILDWNKKTYSTKARKGKFDNPTYGITFFNSYIEKPRCEDSIHTSTSSVPAHVHLSSHISRYKNRSIHSANTTVEKGSMERMRRPKLFNPSSRPIQVYKEIRTQS